MRAIRLSLLAVVTCACASAKPPPGQPELKSLDFDGNHALKSGDIADKIATTADSWIPLSDAKYLDRAVLETDTKRIERLYQSRGYFDAKVTGVEVNPVQGKSDLVTVKVHIDEGQPSAISRMDVQGVDGLPDDVKARVDRAVKKLTVGTTFNEEDYDAAKAALTRILHNHGYALATVNGEVTVDPAAHTAVVTFTIDLGERYKFGPVVVSGTAKVPRDKVANEVRDAAPQGELYSDKALEDAQNRVFDIGVFSLAKVTRGAPDPATHELPVAVEVTEAPFRTLRAGAGVGLERQREEVRGIGEYVNRNFLGGLRKLDFDNRLAYVVSPDVVALAQGNATSGIAGHSKLTFTQPDLWLNDLDLNLTTQVERDIEIGYTYNSALAGVGFEKRWGRQVDATIQYNFQVLQLNTLVDPKQLSASHAPQLATTCTDPSCFLVLEYLEERVQLDERDSATRPKSGYFASVDLQEGGGPGSSFRYLRLEPEVRGFVPITRQLILAERLQWGWMKSFGTDADGNTLPTPLTQRFFGGGANSVRSYGSRLMAPVAVVCRDTNTNLSARHCSASSDFEAVPVGGDGLYEATTELRYDVTKTVGVVGFLDAGAVPITPFGLRAQDIAIAPGLGLRYYSLFGPVRLDFAYRLPGFGPDDGQLRLAPSQVVINYPPASGGFVSPGRTGRFDFQFSIGEAF